MRLALPGIVLLSILVILFNPGLTARLLDWYGFRSQSAALDDPARSASAVLVYPDAESTLEAAPADVFVVDADTLRVGPVRVRLDGITAPESGHRHFQAGRRYLADLLGTGARLRCGLTGARSYKREIGYCLLRVGAEEIDIQAAVVAAGLARDCPRYSGGRYQRFETEASRALPLPGYCQPR